MNNKFKSLILSGAALSLWSGASLAADFAPTPEPAFGGFYAGVFGGATWFTENGADFTLDGCEIASGNPCHPDVSGNVSLDTDTGFLVGGTFSVTSGTALVASWTWVASRPTSAAVSASAS
jgi:hypothetical protein